MGSSEVIHLHRINHDQEVKDARSFRYEVEELVKKGQDASVSSKSKGLWAHFSQKRFSRKGVPSNNDLWKKLPGGGRVAFLAEKPDTGGISPNLRGFLETTLNAPLENLLFVVERNNEAHMKCAKVAVYKPGSEGLGPSVTAHSYDGLLRFSAQGTITINDRQKNSLCKGLVEFASLGLSHHLQTTIH